MCEGITTIVDQVQFEKKQKIRYFIEGSENLLYPLSRVKKSSLQKLSHKWHQFIDCAVRLNK